MFSAVSKRVIPFFFIFILLCSIFIFNVSSEYGSQEDYIEDYEDDTVGFNATDEYYNFLYYNSTWIGADEYTPSTELVYTGTNSFKVCPSGYNNEHGSRHDFTYGLGTVLENLTYFWRPDENWGSDQSGSYSKVRFYNELNQLMFSFQQYGNRLWRLVDNNGITNFGFNIEGSPWIRTSIVRLDNDTYNITVDDGTNHYYDCTPLVNSVTNSDGRNTITWFNWTSDNWNAGDYYRHFHFMDNVTLDLSGWTGEEETPDIPECCYECNEYGGVGMGGTTYYRYWNQPPSGKDVRYIYTRYNVPVSGNITRIDLQIEDDMALGYGYYLYPTVLPFSERDVLCKVNDNYLGSASELVRIGQTDIYRLSWTNIEIPISNEEIYIMFKSYAYFSFTGRYGTWAVYGSNADLNGDSEKFFAFLDERHEGTWQTFNQGDNYKTIDLTSQGIESLEKDLIMRLCFDPDDVSWELQDYANSLTVSPSTACGNQSVAVTYFLNQSAMLYDDKYIYIDKQGSGIVDGYPVKLYTQSRTFQYTPTSQGIYYVNLSVNSVNVTSKTLTVNCDLSNYIYTVPNPSAIGQKYQVYYKYNYVTYSAKITCIQTGDEWWIQPSSSGSFWDSQTRIGYYVYEMEQYNNDTGLYYAVTDNRRSPHFVSGTTANYFEVNPDSIPIGDCTRISGYHSHLGETVLIKVGSSYIENGNVGNQENFDVTYCPEKAGEYTVQLLWKSGNEEIELYPYQILTVGSGGELPEEESPQDQIVPEDARLYVSVAIILAFIFAPMYIAGKIKQKWDIEVRIPIITYVATATVGVGICVRFGWIDLWWLIIMIVALVSSAVFMLMLGRNGE